MTDINFVVPLAGYTGFSVESIVSSILSGNTIDDICIAFQKISGNEINNTEEHGFFYDYLLGLVERYPELLDNINQLREHEGLTRILK